MASEVTDLENPAPLPPLKETGITNFAAVTPMPLHPPKEPGAKNLVAANPPPLPPPKDPEAPALEINRHQKAVHEISTTMRGFYERKKNFYNSHGATSSTLKSDKGQDIIDTSHLSNVLKIDILSRTVLVEPNVPMDQLVEETLKYGLIPPVVMGSPGSTVGEGYANTAGGSSTFKHGFFDRTINYTEMVLASGDLVTCSDAEKPDLFHGAAGALETLGITTLFELQLLKATKYVETTYYPISSMSEAIEGLEHLTTDPDIDYIDGILFSLTQGAIITGRLSDTPKPGTPIRYFSAAKDPWFYLHVQQTIKNLTHPITEAIPLPEYLFRHDRGAFSLGTTFFKSLLLPFNSFTRRLFNDFLHARMLQTYLATTAPSRLILQDFAIPYSAAADFVTYVDKSLGIYPLYLCPFRQSPTPTLHPSSPQPLLNISIRGLGPRKHADFLKTNQDLEAYVRKLGGVKALDAQTYATEEELWSLYDREWYDGLREKYGAKGLPSLYEEVKVDEYRGAGAKVGGGKKNPLKTCWPFAGFYGLKKAWESGLYLEVRGLKGKRERVVS